MLAQRNRDALNFIISLFTDCGYNVTFKLLNAADYKVPQDRKRVIFVGYRKDLKQKFIHPTGTSIFPNEKLTLKDAIFDLQETALPSLEKNRTNGEHCKVKNHEYMLGNFSTIYMSRNRVRSWDEQSFTIQAGKTCSNSSTSTKDGSY